MQIVVFKLGDEHFAVETDRVQSINDIMGITRVPKAPSYIKGLINLRGSIKSLVDINLLLDVMPGTEQNNIIILTVEDEEIGISVDEVEEVLDIDEKDIQKLEKGTEKDQSYIKGILNYEEKLLTIIDIDKLLN
ncbi:chemotaxis protein CheW [Clostridium saccharobutylicum]|uniref:Chemotaxis signal transduction protein n=1 Tax=Clostridium saccharobutylicum DSM 13864 TaxID=1345695 RepID=U5MZL2_CLOSA|nr:chemotaxis protein CheW [Clostridium saccharobutylicum]AGX44937.1 chemotaxis signal transduction protein [Clostridium saccharobutylicum DSM 13864]AQR92219.1 chemotaxis protein CheW [Clostridium saccharobutylicum]AQS02121.1 chemotaxis protein CheW [Clostridium saccharobutylicum]AQS11725.1 chemotaxis protein CheW [Clostridium saccharobutylicum]AQS16104.1 chemotaxis protein CheW [Clostridium saccharobutylicum]